MQELSIMLSVVFVVALLFWSMYLLSEHGVGVHMQKVLVVLLFSVFILNEGYESTVGVAYSVKQEHLIVSASPSSLKTESGIGGNFLYFSGYSHQTRFYLLREKVSNNLYKDLEVSGEVYIRESSKYKNKGLYFKTSICYHITQSYTLLSKKWAGKTRQKCAVSRQEIIVPNGSVIKELKV